ncbi:MAG: hypothetical protein M0T70_01235 [Geobacteraceae bacterium]|nr:hypothetical protein [Geobacteraceae bacterium]
MYPSFMRLILYFSLLLVVGCSSNNVPDTSSTPANSSSNAAVFDPSTGDIPMPNVLATAAAEDPLTQFGISATTVGARPANTPMNPAEALAYVNNYEMGGTSAVSGVNAPIYIHFNGPLDASTVTGANIKVFQTSTSDSDGTENHALAFADITGMFTIQYTAGSTDLFLFPNFPLQPGSKYLYVVSSRVKDAASGKSVSSSFYFNALKSLFPLVGPFAQLEQVRADKMSGSNILFRGYFNTMNDLIANAATTTIASRDDIAVMGRFITTGAGFIPTDATNSATRIPMESALRLFAAGAGLGGLPGKTWNNSISNIVTLPAAAYWGAIPGAGSAPASVNSVVTGTFNSADLSIDPVIAKANATTMDLSSVTGAYNPAAGVVQAFRNGASLTGFYLSLRSVPFVYLVPSTPNGKVIIFQHGITGQKEQVVAVAGALTAAGYAVVAIDLPLHGALAVPTHTSGDLWGQDFMALGAPLATRSNIQQGAFNLDRLEFTLKTGAFIAAGVTSALPTEIDFVGQSLGSIVGSYYLAGNTTLATSGLPYTQTTLNSDMKGFLSVPGGRLAYLIQNSPAFSPSVNAGLLAQAHIATGSPTYHQFFQATQSIVDPADPATMTTPLASGLPSRLSGRIAIQEATSTTFSTSGAPTNGDLVITNPYTRYFGNALGGREVLGAAAAAVAPGFKQLGYRGGATPRIPSSFMFTLIAGTPAPKVDFAAAQSDLAATSPSEGYFQFDQTGVGHGFLLDPTASLTNTQYAQSQMVNFLLRGVIVDPTPSGVAKLATASQIPAKSYEVRVPPVMKIFGY